MEYPKDIRDFFKKPITKKTILDLMKLEEEEEHLKKVDILLENEKDIEFIIKKAGVEISVKIKTIDF